MPTVSHARQNRVALFVIAIGLIIACTIISLQVDGLSHQLSAHLELEQKQVDFNKHLHEHFHPVSGARLSDHTHVLSNDAQPRGAHLHHQFASNTHAQGNPIVLPEWAPVSALAVAIPASRSTDEAYLTLIGELASTCL